MIWPTQPMSAFGVKRTPIGSDNRVYRMLRFKMRPRDAHAFESALMSAFGIKADVAATLRNVR